MADFTLLGMAAHMVQMVHHIDVAETHALDRAAEIIQEEAKASLGHYQPQSGPFDAWAPLADATKEDRVAKGYPEDEPELRDGTLRDSIERSVQPQTGVFGMRTAETGSDSPIMEFQELGTVNMPPRSIMGGAAARKEDEVREVLGLGFVSALMIGSGSQIAGSFIPIRRR